MHLNNLDVHTCTCIYGTSSYFSIYYTCIYLQLYVLANCYHRMHREDLTFFPLTWCVPCTRPGPVKKCGLLKVLHEKYKPESAKKQPSSESLTLRKCLQEVAETNKDLQPHIHKAQVHACTCMYVCMNVCMYVCVFVCMCVCI